MSLEQLTMVTPLLVYFATLLLPIYTQNIKDINFFFLLNISSIINNLLKTYIFKPLFMNKSYPLIGQGIRPKGARGTGTFKSNKLSTTYGMPSGHSQTAAVFSTYLIMTRVKNYMQPLKSILTILLVIYALIIMYGRVYLTKAHTIQQTIVGALCGIGLVYIYQSYLAF